jgi:DNA replication protein
MPDLLKKRGVRAKNRNNNFENFRIKNGNETALEAAKAFATNGDTTLLFIGPTGVGKTHLAVSVMVEYLKAGKECWFVKEAGMGRDISDSRCFNTKETIKSMHNRYCSYPLLVIDELGKGTWTNGEATEILDIIDDRIEEEDRKTILISNLSWNDFSKRFGDRITSRLDGYGKLVQILDGDNRRGMKNENGNGTAKLNTPSDAKNDTANALKMKSGEITQLSKNQCVQGNPRRR